MVHCNVKGVLEEEEVDAEELSRLQSSQVRVRIEMVYIMCIHDGYGTHPGGAEEWREEGIVIKQVELGWRLSTKGSLALSEAF